MGRNPMYVQSYEQQLEEELLSAKETILKLLCKIEDLERKVYEETNP